MDVIKYLMNKPHRRMIKAGCDMLLMAKMASGNVSGVNSPLANPWVDLTKNGNNATFQNIAGTTSDGWVNVLLPNGKTMPFLKLDGVDTVGIIPNNPSVDIVGLDEFSINILALTPSVLIDGYIYCKSTLTNLIDQQLSVLTLSNGNIAVRLGGNDYTIVSNIQPNLVYDIWIYRTGGRLFLKVNSIEKYNQLNSINLISQPNARIGARSTNAGGTTHSAFCNWYIGALSIAKNPDFTKLSSAWARIVSDYI